MSKIYRFFLIPLFILGFTLSTHAIDIPGVKGDGVHDDTAGLQALLDSRQSTIYLPAPPKHYLISEVLKIHSGQTLVVDRNAVIRTTDNSGAHLLTNADYENGNQRITVIGGIWDGNNLTQVREQRPHSKKINNSKMFLGVIMYFENVKNLRIDGVTFKDPEYFAFLAGNIEQFTIENITFDYNLARENMDGIHLVSNCHHGRIANLKGTTNDDLVALNADEASSLGIKFGPITNIEIDGIWAENTHRAVRLLSCISPVKKIKISNIFGSYQYGAICLSNHNILPDCSGSRFEDISISGMYCTNSQPTWAQQIRVYAPAVVTNLTISDCHRTEETATSDQILVEEGAHVRWLSISNSSLENKCNGNIVYLHNQGTIDALYLNGISLQGSDGKTAELLKNDGEIGAITETAIHNQGGK